MTIDKPTAPSARGETKKSVTRYHLENNSPASKKEIRPVIFKVYRGENRLVCHSHFQRGTTVFINPGEIYAKEDTFGEWDYCLDCVRATGGIRKTDLVAVNITYKLKRKSRRYPYGVTTVPVVNTRKYINSFVRDLNSAGYPAIDVKKITGEK